MKSTLKEYAIKNLKKISLHTIKNRSLELPIHSILHVFLALQTLLPKSSCTYRRAAFEKNSR